MKWQRRTKWLIAVTVAFTALYAKVLLIHPFICLAWIVVGVLVSTIIIAAIDGGGKYNRDAEPVIQQDIEESTEQKRKRS
jgi:hypothetical protein